MRQSSCTPEEFKIRPDSRFISFRDVRECGPLKSRITVRTEGDSRSMATPGDTASAAKKQTQIGTRSILIQGESQQHGSGAYYMRISLPNASKKQYRP